MSVGSFIAILYACMTWLATPAGARRVWPALDEWFGRLHEHRWVKVEARMDGKGSMHAEEITELDGDLDESELETTIVAVNANTKCLRSRFGTPIVVTEETRILGGDKRAADFAALRVGDRISILKRNIEGARTKVEFAKVNFQLGRASNLDITDAQKDLLDAETNQVNELVNYRVELARLEQLLGGSI